MFGDKDLEREVTYSGMKEMKWARVRNWQDCMGYTVGADCEG